MSVLSLAVFLQLAATCAPGIAPETLAAVAHVESSRDPNTIHINGPGGGARHYPSAEAAAADARALIVAGRSIDLGIMQINNRNMDWLGLDLAAAFDPCRSIAAGAHVLAAESSYNTGSPTRGISNGYAGKVQRAELMLINGNSEPAQAVAAAVAQPAPPLCAPSWDPWALASCSAHTRHATTSPQPQPTNTETASR